MHHHARMHAMRLGRISEPGRVYSVTTVADGRACLFRNLYLARAVASSIGWVHEQRWVHSLAWCLMPDHLHWLFRLGKRRTLPAVVQSVKGYSARQINQMRGTPGKRVWQEGYYESTVRANTDLRELARYIVANPLRDGIVEDLRDYPHWDAIWLSADMDPADLLL